MEGCTSGDVGSGCFAQRARAQDFGDQPDSLAPIRISGRGEAKGFDGVARRPTIAKNTRTRLAGVAERLMPLNGTDVVGAQVRRHRGICLAVCVGAALGDRGASALGALTSLRRTMQCDASRDCAFTLECACLPVGRRGGLSQSSKSFQRTRAVSCLDLVFDAVSWVAIELNTVLNTSPTRRHSLLLAG